MKIQLQHYGDIECRLPSLAICYDVVSMWSGTQDRNIMGRLCALAVCCAVPDNRFPAYTVTMSDPIGHGGVCLEFLLNQDVPISQIINQGIAIITWFANKLPSESEVNEVENFTEQNGQQVSNG